MTRLSALGLVSVLVALSGCQKRQTQVPDEVADADADNAPPEEDYAPSEELGGGTEEEEQAPNLGRRPLH